MEKVWFYERLFFEVVIFMTKDKKKNNMKDAMSIKITFMHCMKGIRVMLTVVYEKFKLVCIFLLFFLFTTIFNL